MILESATGRPNAIEAVEWIADGYSLEDSAEPHAVLKALVKLDEGTPNLDRAIQRITRDVTLSKFDSSAILLGTDRLPDVSRFRKALHLLAHHCRSKGLESINASALIAAQRKEPETIEVLCAVAGLSYSELRERGVGFPADSTGSWAPAKLREAFAILDEVVTSDGSTSIPGAIATRSIELMRVGGASGGDTGWKRIERLRTEGVPYELLLAQRVAGGTWLAHRNQTSSLLNHTIAGQVQRMLEDAGLKVLRSRLLAGSTPPSHLQELADCDRQVGIVVLRGSKAAYGIVFATARDQGSARSSGAQLFKMRRAEHPPFALVLTGKGWAARNETADLARSFGGRLFTELTLDALVGDVLAVVRDSRRRSDRDSDE